MYVPILVRPLYLSTPYSICSFSLYLFLLSLLLCPPPSGRKISQVLFTYSNFIELYQTANLYNISKLSKCFNVKVSILLHFA